MKRWLLARALLVLFSNVGIATSSSMDSSPHKALIQEFGSLNVPFIENLGQIDQQVRFYSKMIGGTLFVTDRGEMVYSLSGQQSGTVEDIKYPRSLILTERLIGGNNIKVSGGEPSAAGVNVFHGNQPEMWQTGLETYQSIRLHDVYENIELELKAHGNNIEKLFHIDAGADPNDIILALSGAESVQITDDGRLQVMTNHGVVYFTRPVAWQDIGGQRAELEVTYSLDLKRANQYGFEVAAHDPAYPLTIDPLLQSTYVSGSGTGDVLAIAVHPISGDVYIAGQTTSSDFPGIDASAPDSSADTVFVGTNEAFVARLGPNLKTPDLIQTTYLGGDETEIAYDIGIHPVSGDIYVTGFTRSDNFPNITSGADTTRNGIEGFISQLTSNLQTLIQSTYLGGSSDDSLFGLAIHPVSGDIYVTGNTFSNDFPAITNGADQTRIDTEGFVSRLPANLQSITQSSFLGGSKPDSATDIAIHHTSGQIYITGLTLSSDFPNVTDAADTVLGGTRDAFVALFTTNLQTLTQTTYLGGGNDEIDGGTFASIAIHPMDGRIYIIGTTKSSDFPAVSNGADSIFAGNHEAFVALLESDLKSQTQSTFLGGNLDDYGYSIAIHPTSGNVYSGGFTSSSDFPGLSGGDDSTLSGNDGFITRLSDDLQTLTQSTLLGGNSSENIAALAVHPGNGYLYAAGGTRSSSFPMIPGGADITRSATSIAPFVSVYDSLTSTSNPGTLQFTASEFMANEQDASATISVSRSGGSTGVASVQFLSSDGSAIAGDDYASTTGSLTWLNGDASDKTFKLSISNDLVEERNETVNVDLIGVVGATLGSQSAATLTISDNDGGMFYVIPVKNGSAVIYN